MMTPAEARAIIKEGYGEKRSDAKDSCFGQCCVSKEEQDALLDLIYAEETQA